MFSNEYGKYTSVADTLCNSHYKKLCIAPTTFWRLKNVILDLIENPFR